MEVKKSCVNCSWCKTQYGEVRCAKGQWERNGKQLTKKEIGYNGHFVSRLQKWARKKAEGCLWYE